MSENLTLTLSIRQLAEFLLRTGSIDSRFSGFDRALEGARLHRKLQKAAVKNHPDYKAEVTLRAQYAVSGIDYTLEGRADGIFTDTDGTAAIHEIKTTTQPPELITGEQFPEHWAQAQIYAAIYAQQNDLPRMRVRLTYYQVDEELEFDFAHEYSASALQDIVTDLLTRYAPWAKRAALRREESRAALQVLKFPFSEYRPGQRAMMNAVYTTCQQGGQLLCQAPTGIGKTMSVLYPALKAVGDGGPIFYLTARGTARLAAENALHILRKADPDLPLHSISLTAKDKICMLPHRDCTPEACPYANGYYDRAKDALWDTLDTPELTAAALHAAAAKHRVCPFELGLDLSLWSDVIIGDYNYLFDPVVRLERFFELRGDYLFLLDEAHNLPGRARDMHSAALCKSEFMQAKKVLGKGKSSLKNALNKVNTQFIEWRHACEEAGSHRTVFAKELPEAFVRALTKLCDPLEIWLNEHREPNEAHDAMLQLYFDVRGFLRCADTFDEHFVFQTSAHGSEVRAVLLCLDPSAFLAQDFAKGRAAVLFSATLSPAGYYKDLCGIPDAKAVALRSPFPRENLGLWCASHISTRYKDRDGCITQIAELLAEMVSAKPGNYLAFFPSYSYMQKVFEAFVQLCPDTDTLCQTSGMEEVQRAEFLAKFAPHPDGTLLGFAVMGGVFGEGVDLTGDRLIGVAVIGPGLPQVGPRQEQLREYFDITRGAGFDYAYRFPGMNKVLQAAGRVIRTPDDKGVVLLIDDRFAAPDTRRLMPPHWENLGLVNGREALQKELQAFWGK